MADVGIRGVKVANDADAVRLYQPDGLMGSQTMFAPPAVVDLGDVVTVRNMIASLNVKRTTDVESGSTHYQYEIQSGDTNMEWFRSALQQVAGWYPASFHTDFDTNGPSVAPRGIDNDGNDSQQWIYDMEFRQPGTDTRDIYFALDNSSDNGTLPIMSPGDTFNVTGHYHTPVDESDYKNLFITTPLVLQLNGIYYFRWWAMKVA